MKYIEQQIQWLGSAGHGAETKGKRSPVWEDGSQLIEWEFNEAVLKLLIDKLENVGIYFHDVAPESRDISLAIRANRAIRYESYELPKVYISIHANGFYKESANGVEIFTTRGNTKSDEYASIILNNLKNHLPHRKFREDWSDNDSDKEAGFEILRRLDKKPHRIPAVLVELGFFTNREECILLLSDEYRDSCASALFDSIIEIEKKLMVSI